MALARLYFPASSAPTTTSAAPSAVVRRACGSVTGQYFPMVTAASCEEHLAVESLTYVELLKKDGMEEEADVFALYSSSLREATGIN